MLNTFVKSKGVMKTITHNNNKTNSNEINMDADYDGNIANIKLQTNNNGQNKDYNIQLSNDDLANLLNVPSVNKSLDLRLLNDFKKTKMNHQKHHHHHNKTKHKRKPLIIEFENPSFLDDDYNFTNNSSSSSLPNDLFDSLSSSSSSSLSNDLFDSSLQNNFTHLSSPNSQDEFIIPLTLNNSKLNKNHKKRKHKTHKVYKIKKPSLNASSSSSRKYHYSRPRRRKRIYDK